MSDTSEDFFNKIFNEIEAKHGIQIDKDTKKSIVAKFTSEITEGLILIFGWLPSIFLLQSMGDLIWTLNKDSLAFKFLGDSMECCLKALCYFKASKVSESCVGVLTIKEYVINKHVLKNLFCRLSIDLTSEQLDFIENKLEPYFIAQYKYCSDRNGRAFLNIIKFSESDYVLYCDIMRMLQSHDLFKCYEELTRRVYLSASPEQK